MSKKVSKFALITLTIGLFSGIANADWRNYFQSKHVKTAGIVVGGLVAARVGIKLAEYALTKNEEIRLNGLINQIKNVFKNPKQLDKHQGRNNPFKINSGPFGAHIYKSVTDSKSYVIAIWHKTGFLAKTKALVSVGQLLHNIGTYFFSHVYISFKPKKDKQEAAFLQDKQYYIQFFKDNDYLPKEEKVWINTENLTLFTNDELKNIRKKLDIKPE